MRKNNYTRKQRIIKKVNHELISDILVNNKREHKLHPNIPVPSKREIINELQRILDAAQELNCKLQKRAMGESVNE